MPGSIFSHEFEKANAYFLKHRDRVKVRRITPKKWLEQQKSTNNTLSDQPLLSNSYIKTTDGSIFRILSKENSADVALFKTMYDEGNGGYNRKLLLGAGASARVKLAEDKDGNLYALKVIHQIHPLSNLLKEAHFSYQARLLLKAPTIRTQTTLPYSSPSSEVSPLMGTYQSDAKNSKVTKAYLVQELRGSDLFDFNERKYHETNRDGERVTTREIAAEELDLSIQLLMRAYQLHEGISTQDKRALVHLDIKPENLTFNKNCVLDFVDYGAASTNIHAPILSEPTLGTLEYSPLGMGGYSKYTRRPEYQNLTQSRYDQARKRLLSGGNTKLHADLFGEFITICSSKDQPSIFTPSTQKEPNPFLPEPLRNLIQTEDEDRCLANLSKGYIFEELVLAAFIEYQNTNFISEKKVDELRNHPELRRSLIESYTRKHPDFQFIVAPASTSSRSSSASPSIGYDTRHSTPSTTTSVSSPTVSLHEQDFQKKLLQTYAKKIESAQSVDDVNELREQYKKALRQNDIEMGIKDDLQALSIFSSSHMRIFDSLCKNKINDLSSPPRASDH